MPIHPMAHAQSIGYLDNSLRRPILAVLSVLCAAVGIVALQTPSAVSGAFPTQMALRYMPADVMRCSQRAWPYYESQCLRTYAGESRVVRVIPLDRRRSADVTAASK